MGTLLSHLGAFVAGMIFLSLLHWLSREPDEEDDLYDDGDDEADLADDTDIVED